MSSHLYQVQSNLTNCSTTFVELLSRETQFEDGHGGIVDCFEEVCLEELLGERFREILSFWVWLDRNDHTQKIPSGMELLEEQLKEKFCLSANAAIIDFLYELPCNLSPIANLATMEIVMLDYGLSVDEMMFFPLTGCRFPDLECKLTPAPHGDFSFYASGFVHYIPPTTIPDKEIQITLTVKQLQELYSLIPVVASYTDDIGVLGELAKADLHFLY